MTFQEMAGIMMPMWFLGVFVLFCTWKSGYGELIKVDMNAIKKWMLYLIALNSGRALLFSLTEAGHRMLIQSAENISFIPWQTSFFVFWEDAAHTLPLVLLRILLGNRWWAKPIHFLAMFLIMFDFGSGHLYQGVFAALGLAFYIPMTMKIGQEKGFGTVMICHSLYDLTTILLIQNMARLM